MDPHFKAHLFICTNDRGPNGKRPSCAHRGAQELRDQVKTLCKELRGSIRVNNSGCLDQCEHGVTAVLYPSGQWFLDLKPEDAGKLADAVKAELEKK